jgi:hypothetical protein
VRAGGPWVVVVAPAPTVSSRTGACDSVCWLTAECARDRMLDIDGRERVRAGSGGGLKRD